MDQLGERGTVLEFGVASGNTFVQLAKSIKDNQLEINLIGFDSFKGLPEEAEGVWRPGWHMKGEFEFGQQHVNSKMMKAGLSADNRFKLVSGFYEQSLKSQEAILLRSEIDCLLFVNIDVDLYVSTKQLLDYIRPVLQVGTVLYFDDWKDPAYDYIQEPWGEHRAWAEFSARNPEVQAENVRIGSSNERYKVITHA